MPAIASRDEQAIHQQAEVFCKHYAVELPQLQAAIRSCTYLLTQASTIGLPKQRFSDDLDALSGDERSANAVLLRYYDQAMTLMRDQIIENSLFDHGNVLVGLDWRLDAVLASDRGAGLDLPVALITLRCREGKRDTRSTITVAPHMLSQLRDVCARLEALVGQVQSK